MNESPSRPVDGMRPNSDVVARRLGDTSVLVHLGSGAILELNDTASRVWELIAEGAPFERIASTLSDEFEISVENAHVAARRFVDQLRNEGMLL